MAQFTPILRTECHKWGTPRLLLFAAKDSAPLCPDACEEAVVSSGTLREAWERFRVHSEPPRPPCSPAGPEVLSGLAPEVGYEDGQSQRRLGLGGRPMSLRPPRARHAPAASCPGPRAEASKPPPTPSGFHSRQCCRVREGLMEKGS